MLTLILTRHGLTPAGNVLLGGQLDVPLAPKGRAQAESLRGRLDAFNNQQGPEIPLLVAEAG